LWIQARKALEDKQPLVLLSFPLVILVFIANALRLSGSTRLTASAWASCCLSGGWPGL
jgi:hypothetical protein